MELGAAPTLCYRQSRERVLGDARTCRRMASLLRLAALLRNEQSQARLGAVDESS